MNAFRTKCARIDLNLLAIGVLLGMVVATCSTPGPVDSGGAQNSPAEALAGAFVPTPAFAQVGRGGGATLADVAERAVPSVVNISATKVIRRRIDPFFDDPFFREFFGPVPSVPRERQAKSLGSGVIVSADGLVLTNNHVVSGAQELKVTLSDGREFEAEVVGSDPETDVAVVRLQGQVTDLPPLALGDSSNLRLGDVVLAIGNPFGVGQTVTMGIISATGRSRVGIVDYEDFIQTDAAINPGNSGGALVNMNGELIGINTAILSRTGGYQGVGFAIPTDLAEPIMRGLIRDGKIVRGWLGVTIQELNKDLAEGLGIDINAGVLISEVHPDSSAAKAGLERGDVVVELDGKAMISASRLRNALAAKQPGAKVTLKILRDGKRKTVVATLGARPADVAATAEVGESAGPIGGIVVANLSKAARSKYKVPDKVKTGVVVTKVKAGSFGQRAGLREGDVIMEVNRKPVDSVAAFGKLHKKAGRSIALLVYRDGAMIYLALRR
jgi:serine protease Do